MNDVRPTPGPLPLARAALTALDDSVTQDMVYPWWQASRAVSRRAVASGELSPGQQGGQVCMTAFLGEVHRLLGADDAELIATSSVAVTEDELRAYLASKVPAMRASTPEYLPILQGFLDN